MALPQRDSNGRFIKSTDTKNNKSFTTKKQLQKDLCYLKQENFNKDTIIKNLQEKLRTSKAANIIMVLTILALLGGKTIMKFLTY